MEWSVAAKSAPGETTSGDSYLVKETPSGCLIAVVDALGHGAEAAETAKLAIEALKASEDVSIIQLARKCHDRLIGTRGVVFSLCLLSKQDSTLTWMSIGNVEGTVFHRDTHLTPTQEFLLLRGGVVGDHLPNLSAGIVQVSEGDLLVLTTDGVRTGFHEEINWKATSKHIAEAIMQKNWRGNDDALVLVARYMNSHNGTAAH